MGSDFFQGLIIDQFCRINVLPYPVLHLIYGTFVDRPYAYYSRDETGDKRGYQEAHYQAVLQV
jgi:hypothetical protein